ncbi:MAG: stage II sporulation protein P [Eubacterium sp.]|nr:stage II sporulation protein P [Eubacterium sp.]
MRRYNMSWKAKTVPVLLVAAVVSFVFTGVAESTVSDIEYYEDAAAGLLVNIAQLSAYMTLPSNGIDIALPGGQAVQTVGDSVGVTDDTDTESADRTDSRTESDSAPDNDKEDNTSEISTPSEPVTGDAEETQIPVDSHPQSQSLLVSKNITVEYMDAEKYTAHSGPIRELTYGRATDSTAIDLEHGQIRNLTELSNTEVYHAAQNAPTFGGVPDGGPQVLIIHTHTTEAYEPNYEDGYYDESFDGRTLDPGYSVVGVGAAMAQALADNGIGVVHDGTLFDEPLYNGAYSRSGERIKELLTEYPSIRIVIDLHRDGIADGDTRIAPVADIDGQQAAQVMIICGADDGSGILPDYLDNLGFAAAVQQTAEQMYPGLTRPLLFDYRIYNQDLGNYNVLIEVGAFGNSPEQARYSGTLMGNALAELIKG